MRRLAVGARETQQTIVPDVRIAGACGLPSWRRVAVENNIVLKIGKPASRGGTSRVGAGEGDQKHSAHRPLISCGDGERCAGYVHFLWSRDEAAF